MNGYSKSKITNLSCLFSSELGEETTRILMQMDLEKFKQHCSFFAVWGSRTQFGQLFSMRFVREEGDVNFKKFGLVARFWG